MITEEPQVPVVAKSDTERYCTLVHWISKQLRFVQCFKANNTEWIMATVGLNYHFASYLGLD